MPLHARLPLLLVAVAAAGSARVSPTSAAAEPPAVSFKRDVAPILLRQCQTCHGPDKVKGKYRVDAFDKLLKPGSSGDPAITAGKPDASTLYTLLVAHDPDERMPQKADPLPPAQVETIKRWVAEGAKFDGPDPAAALSAYVESGGGGGPSAGGAPIVYKRPIPITSLAFAAGGAELLAGGYHELTRWDAKSGTLVGRVPLPVQRVQAAAVDPASGRLAVAGGTPGVGGELLLIDPPPASGPGGAAGAITTPPSVRSLEKTADLMLSARFSLDGTRLAAGGSDGGLRVYEVAAGKLLWKAEPHADWVTDVAFSPDGTLVATASRDKSCRVFDAATGRGEASYQDHTEPVFAVAFAADGQSLFSGGRDRKLHRWAAADGKSLGQTGGFGGDILRLAVAGPLVWSAAGDGKLRAHAADEAAAPPAPKPATKPASRPGTRPATNAVAGAEAKQDAAQAKKDADAKKKAEKPAARRLVRTIAASPEWLYALAAAGGAEGRVAVGSHDGRVHVFASDSGTAVSDFIAAPGLK